MKGHKKLMEDMKNNPWEFPRAGKGDIATLLVELGLFGDATPRLGLLGRLRLALLRRYRRFRRRCSCCGHSREYHA